MLKNGVQLTFTQPLAANSVADTQNCSGKRWNYAHTEKYGSSEFSLAMNENGKPKTGRNTLDITGPQLSPEGKTVTLTIVNFKLAMSHAVP